MGVYYNLDSTLPRDLPSIVANGKLSDEFNMSTTHMLMLSADMPEKEVRSLASEIKKMDGVKYALGFSTIKGAGIPEEIIPDKLKSSFKNDNWQILLIGSASLNSYDIHIKICPGILVGIILDRS